jgi:hypothetical protein
MVDAMRAQLDALMGINRDGDKVRVPMQKDSPASREGLLSRTLWVKTHVPSRLYRFGTQHIPAPPSSRAPSRSRWFKG